MLDDRPGVARHVGFARWLLRLRSKRQQYYSHLFTIHCGYEGDKKNYRY